MAKKKVKELSPKEAAKQNFSYQLAVDTAKRAGEPTKHFLVGEKVHVGALKNCVIDEVSEDGKIYGITYGTGDSYRYDAWVNVHPVKGARDSNFRQDQWHGLNLSHRTIQSLIHMHYSAGVDFHPDYQREYVWDDQDREKLLDSMFAGNEIGRFVLVEREYQGPSKPIYEIVDGKQRLLTMLAFVEGRFSYHGYFYDDLSPEDRFAFLNTTTAVAILPSETSRERIVKIFLATNKCGKPVPSEVLERAEEILHTIQKSEELQEPEK